MRPCFTPTAGGTFFKNLQHTIVVRKDAFEFVIKLERGSYFTASLFPLRENRMLMAAYWGKVLTLLPDGVVDGFLKDKEGIQVWRSGGDGEILGLSQTIDCGMNPIDALFTKPVCDAVFALCNACVKLYNHCVFTFDEEQLVVIGETFG